MDHTRGLWPATKTGWRKFTEHLPEWIIGGLLLFVADSLRESSALWPALQSVPLGVKVPSTAALLALGGVLFLRWRGPRESAEARKELRSLRAEVLRPARQPGAALILSRSIRKYAGWLSDGGCLMSEVEYARFLEDAHLCCRPTHVLCTSILRPSEWGDPYVKRYLDFQRDLLKQRPGLHILRLMLLPEKVLADDPATVTWLVEQLSSGIRVGFYDADRLKQVRVVPTDFALFVTPSGSWAIDGGGSVSGLDGEGSMFCVRVIDEARLSDQREIIRLAGEAALPLGVSAEAGNRDGWRSHCSLLYSSAESQAVVADMRKRLKITT
jgi:hypothetical protein